MFKNVSVLLIKIFKLSVKCKEGIEQCFQLSKKKTYTILKSWKSYNDNILCPSLNNI